MDTNTILTIVVIAELSLAFVILGRTIWVTRDKHDHKNSH